MTPIEGKDAIIQFNTGSGYFNYACATDFALKLTTETKSTKTEGDGFWKDYEGQVNGYGIDLNGLIVLDEDIGAFDLVYYAMNMQKILYRCLFVDTAGNLKRISGTVLITECDLSNPSTDFSTGSIQMLGCKSFVMEDFNADCAALISNAVIGTDSGGKYMQFTASGDTAYIHYQIFGTGDPVAESNVYTADGFKAYFSFFGPDSALNVVAIPYCESDISGPEFDKHF